MNDIKYSLIDADELGVEKDETTGVTAEGETADAEEEEKEEITL